MFVEINGQRIFYQRNTNGKKPLILLHGWGCNGDTMRCIFNFFSRIGYAVYLPDLCGFGQSEPPKKPFSVYDYADIIEQFITRFNIEKPDIIAHSFGGRIALILASRNKVNRLVITGGAGLKPRRNLVYYIKVLRYKIAKKFKRKTDRYGSTDYKNSRGVMRSVFYSTVNTHLDGLLKKIYCPTLLLWGRNDKSTPLYMARKMARKIKNSKLITLNNSGHFAFIDESSLFMRVCKKFLEQE